MSDLTLHVSKHSIGLRKRVILPLLLTGFIILLLDTYLVFYFENRHLVNAIKQQSKAMQQHFKSILDAKTVVMADNLRFIAQDPEVLSTLRHKDREVLLSLSKPLYGRLNKDHNITHLYFHDAQRNNLIRAHKPGRYGDKINRFTALNAEKNQVLSSGLELGPLGTFTLRSVLPVIKSGSLWGYIELGQEIEELIYHAKERARNNLNNLNNVYSGTAT